MEETFLSSYRETGDVVHLMALHDWLRDLGRDAEADAISSSLYGPLVSVAGLVGKVCTSVTQDGREVVFTLLGGRRCKLYHDQDCCENVSIEDIQGDLGDLVGVPILMAEESSNSDDPPLHGADSSYTWTFYRFGTVKGYVTIRFFGSSNGYYSERVDFQEVP